MTTQTNWLHSVGPGFGVGVVAWLAYLPGRWVSTSTSSAVLDVVVTVASIVLATGGTWLTILFPEVLRNLGSSANPPTKLSEALLRAIGTAGFAVAASLAGRLLAAIASTVWPVDAPLRFQGALFALAVVLTARLAISVLAVTAPVLVLQFRLEKAMATSAWSKRLRGSGQTRSGSHIGSVE